MSVFTLLKLPLNTISSATAKYTKQTVKYGPLKFVGKDHLVSKSGDIGTSLSNGMNLIIDREALEIA